MYVCVCVSTAPGVCALGWVKSREHISLLVILCIIVYVTNKVHLSLIIIIIIIKYQYSCFYINVSLQMYKTDLRSGKICWLMGSLKLPTSSESLKSRNKASFTEITSLWQFDTQLNVILNLSFSAQPVLYPYSSVIHITTAFYNQINS